LNFIYLFIYFYLAKIPYEFYIGKVSNADFIRRALSLLWCFCFT